MSERDAITMRFSEAELVARLTAPVQRMLRVACADLGVVPSEDAASREVGEETDGAEPKPLRAAPEAVSASAGPGPSERRGSWVGERAELAAGSGAGSRAVVDIRGEGQPGTRAGIGVVARAAEEIRGALAHVGAGSSEARSISRLRVRRQDEQPEALARAQSTKAPNVPQSEVETSEETLHGPSRAGDRLRVRPAARAATQQRASLVAPPSHARPAVQQLPIATETETAHQPAISVPVTVQSSTPLVADATRGRSAPGPSNEDPSVEPASLAATALAEPPAPTSASTAPIAPPLARSSATAGALARSLVRVTGITPAARESQRPIPPQTIPAVHTTGATSLRPDMHSAVPSLANAVPRPIAPSPSPLAQAFAASTPSRTPTITSIASLDALANHGPTSASALPLTEQALAAVIAAAARRHGIDA